MYAPHRLGFPAAAPAAAPLGQMCTEVERVAPARGGASSWRMVRLRVPAGSSRHRTAAGLPETVHGSGSAGARARLPAQIAGKAALVRSAVIRAPPPAIFAGNRAVARAPTTSAELPAIARRHARRQPPGALLGRRHLRVRRGKGERVTTARGPRGASSRKRAKKISPAARGAARAAASRAGAPRPAAALRRPAARRAARTTARRSSGGRPWAPQPQASARGSTAR